MDFFQYKNEQLYVEDLPVKQLAEEFGTPLYIYSRATLERHWHAGFFSRFAEITHKLPIILRLFYGCYPLRQHCAELQLFSEWQKNKYPL